MPRINCTEWPLGTAPENMTLTSAFRCKDMNGHTAFAICADAQETIGDYRFFLEKLEPTKTGKFQLLIGGSGYSDLIEAFQIRIGETLTHSTARTISELKTLLQAELLDFINIEVRAFTARSKSSKMLRLIIAAHALETMECECWATRASRLKAIGEFELIGLDFPVYRHLAERLHRDDMNVCQALRASLYLLSIAKRTASGIDGPSSLAVLRMGGLWMEEPELIRDAESQLQELTDASDNLAVVLPDIGLTAMEFEMALRDFADEARRIRGKYVRLAGQRIVNRIITGQEVSYPYSIFPEGASLSIHVEEGTPTGDFSVLGDDPATGLYVGRFNRGNFSQDYAQSRLKLCGNRREVGSQVFVEVAPCKLRPGVHHGETNESCISDNWLQTLSATNAASG